MGAQIRRPIDHTHLPRGIDTGGAALCASEGAVGINGPDTIDPAYGRVIKDAVWGWGSRNPIVCPVRGALGGNAHFRRVDRGVGIGHGPIHLYRFDQHRRKVGIGEGNFYILPIQNDTARNRNVRTLRYGRAGRSGGAGRHRGPRRHGCLRGAHRRGVGISRRRRYRGDVSGEPLAGQFQHPRSTE